MLKVAGPDRLEGGDPVETLGCLSPPSVTVGAYSLGVLVEVSLVVWTDMRFGSSFCALETRGRGEDVLCLWD